MPAREVVVRLQLEDGQALPKFQALRKEQAELSIALDKTRKSIRDNEKAYQTLIATEAKTEAQQKELAEKTRANRQQFDLLTKSLADQEIKLLGVTTEAGKLRRELSGVAGAELKVRDAALQAASAEQQAAQAEKASTRDRAKSTAEQERQRKFLQDLRLRSLDLEERAAKKASSEEARTSKAATDKQAKERKFLQDLRLRSLQLEERAAKRAATTSLSARFDTFAANQSKQLSSTLNGLALQYIGVGAAIYGVQRVIGSAIRTVVDFDQALANVSALGGNYKERIEDLGNAARKLGTKFGVGATEATASIEALAKAGVTAEAILSGGLEGALTLAKAGTLDAGQAAEFAAAAMVQFGLAGSDVAHIADVLTAGAIKVQGEVVDVGNALKFAGPVAASLNITLEETVGTLASFAQNGVLGEQAGTSLRGVLSALTSPSKLAAEELLNLGVMTEDGASKLFDAQGKFKGLANLAGVLQEATKNLTQEERANSLGRIFGNQQLTAANILVKEGADGIRFFTNEVSDQGLASRVAEDKLNSAAGAASKLAANWERFVTAVLSSKSAQAIIESISEFIEATADAIERYGEVDVFTKKIDLFYKSLTNGRKGVEQITANSDVIDRYRQIIDSVQAETDATTKLSRATDLRAKALARVHELEKLDLSDANADSERIVTELAVARATAVTANEIVNSIKLESAAKKDATVASGELNAAEEQELATLAELKKQLRELKDARTKPGDNAKEIADIEARIKAIEGEKQTRTSAAKQARLDAESVAGSVANLQKQIRDLQAEQAKSTDSVQFATFQRQIDKLEASIKRIKEASTTPLIDEVFGNLDALPPELTDPGTPLIDELVAEDLRRVAELQEQARLNDIVGIKDYNLERQFLEAEFNAGLITSREELAARLAAIDQEQAAGSLAIYQGLAEGLSQLLTEAYTGQIKDAKDFQKALFLVFLRAAKAQAQLAIAKASVESIAMTDSVATFGAVGVARAGILAALIEGVFKGLESLVQGFDTGGTVGRAPSARGTVTSSWGAPIKRSNGDDVLVTLKRKEKVLNKDQIEELESIAGKGIWGRIGLPGHASYAGIEAFLRDQHQPRLSRVQGLITGGTVASFIPRPSAADLSAERQVAELRAIEFNPEVSVVEIDRVQNRVRVNESLRTA